MTEVKGDFNVQKFDAQQPFETVKRYQLINKDYKIFVDVNIDLFPIADHDKIKLEFTKTLNTDETPTNLEDGYTRNFGENTKMDEYDYAMAGKVFKFVDDEKEKKLAVIASFGGLLLMVYGSPEKLKAYSMGDDVFLLMKKIQ